MGEDVSKARTQEVDTSKADPPKGADSVHEQTREKGERAREDRARDDERAERAASERRPRSASRRLS
jgi:hypothetical protein